MTETDIVKAEEKAKLALKTVGEIFYTNPTETLQQEVNVACDRLKELLYEIQKEKDRIFNSKS